MFFGPMLVLKQSLAIKLGKLLEVVSDLRVESLNAVHQAVLHPEQVMIVLTVFGQHRSSAPCGLEFLVIALSSEGF
jgi:hypothetical protein